jgi:hypothetical protein
VHAAAVDERDTPRAANGPMGTIGHALARRGVSTLLTRSVLALAALAPGCDSLPTTKMTGPTLSQALCVAPADSAQADQVSSRSGTEC